MIKHLLHYCRGEVFVLTTFPPNFCAIISIIDGAVIGTNTLDSGDVLNIIKDVMPKQIIFHNVSILIYKNKAFSVTVYICCEIGIRAVNLIYMAACSFKFAEEN